MAPLPYYGVFKLGSFGSAISGLKRATYRLLKDEAKWQGYLAQTTTQRRTFGHAFAEDLGIAQDRLTAGKVRGELDQATLRALEDAKAFDAEARRLWLAQKTNPVTPTACYPYPVGEGGNICQGLHPTAGLLGNWAIDFCDTPGARVLAVEAGTIQKLSGHSPADDTWDSQGVFGWTVYLRTSQNYVYFITHLGSRNVALNQKVACGDLIGRVGDQKFRPDHTHIGCTSPLGERDAKARITLISQSARVTL